VQNAPLSKKIVRHVATDATIRMTEENQSVMTEQNRHDQFPVVGNFPSTADNAHYGKSNYY